MVAKRKMVFSYFIIIVLKTIPVVSAFEGSSAAGLSPYSPDNATSDTRNPEITVDSNLAEFLYPYALTSLLAYSYKLEHSNPQRSQWNIDRLEHQQLKPLTASELLTTGIETHFNQKTGRFEGRSSGLQARGLIHTPTDTLILGFAGTVFEANYRSLVTMMASFKISQNYEPEILHEAAYLCKSLNESRRFKRIVLTGSSLGGAIAQYASLACGSQAIVFNTLTLPEKLRLKAVLSRNQIDRAPVHRILKDHEKTLIVSKVQGESLNTLSSWSHYFFQSSLPKGVPVFVIPSANPTSSPISQHWAPAIVNALEKQAGYYFENSDF